MDILVCGGTKQQGPPLVRALLDADHAVTIATRGSRPGLFGNRVNEITLDRTRPSSVRSALKGRSFDAVVDTCAYDGEQAKILLETVDCGKYVQYSSAAVYDEMRLDLLEGDFDPSSSNPKMPSPEKARLIPGNAKYQLGKKLAEKEAIAFGKALIVRMPYIGGIEDRSGRLIYFARQIHDRHSFALNDAKARRRFSMCHVSDAGSFVAFALKNNLSGIYNIASDGTTSVLEIINHISEVSGREAIIRWGEAHRCHYDIPGYSLNTGKAKAAGWRFTGITGWLWPTLEHFCRELAAQPSIKPSALPVAARPRTISTPPMNPEKHIAALTRERDNLRNLAAMFRKMLSYPDCIAKMRSFFKSRSYGKVILHGNGEMTRLLYDLRDRLGIHVAYIVEDTKARRIVPRLPTSTVDWPAADAIIICRMDPDGRVMAKVSRSARCQVHHFAEAHKSAKSGE